MTLNKVQPHTAFILAAGFGTRLRPYTDHCPKPMVQVEGRSLIWRCLDHLRAVGVQRVVVNAHYKADMLRDHMAEYMQHYDDIDIHILYEDKILDTGGGVKNALPLLGDQPFYVIAGDNLWTDGASNALRLLAEEWDGNVMDIMTLMQPVSRMVLTRGVGDYKFDDVGTPYRSHDQTGTHMWTNIRLNAPHIYAGEGDVFSFLKIMDECEWEGRLYALEHDGDWHHISTPEDLERVNDAFRTARQAAI